MENSWIKTYEITTSTMVDSSKEEVGSISIEADRKSLTEVVSFEAWREEFRRVHTLDINGELWFVYSLMKAPRELAKLLNTLADEQSVKYTQPKATNDIIYDPKNQKSP